MVTSAGVIFTYAGTGVPGYSGDGGRAPSAHLHSVSDVSAGFMGNMYIDDVINNGIRRAGRTSAPSLPAGGEVVIVLASSLSETKSLELVFVPYRP